MASPFTRHSIPAVASSNANSQFIVWYDSDTLVGAVTVDYTHLVINIQELLGNAVNLLSTLSDDIKTLSVDIKALSNISANIQNTMITIANQTGHNANAVNTIKNIVVANTGIRVSDPYSFITPMLQISGMTNVGDIPANVSVATMNAITNLKSNFDSNLGI